MASSTELAARAIGLMLDGFDRLRLEVSNDDLIKEAIRVRHGKHKSPETLKRYGQHLEHFSEYLESACDGRTFYDASPSDIVLFMNHLEAPGGPEPSGERLECGWCAARGCPDGREGAGWSASTRKSALCSIRFLYTHFQVREDLPDRNPAAGLAGVEISREMGYTPTRDEMRRFLEIAGTPKSRLLAYWMTYAPSRRRTFSTARWQDIDLDARVWRIPGRNAKGKKPDEFRLHPILVDEFRRYKAWLAGEAKRSPQIRRALMSSETAFVLLSKTGKPVHANTLTKMVKWRAVRAGVALIPAVGKADSLDGWTSRMHPHALRRYWADQALNHHEQPIEVVAEVLNHKDISTTRRHYARPKDERAWAALDNFEAA